MRILEAWRFSRRIPIIGHWLFARLVQRVSPYSSSIFPIFESLESGFCRVALLERRALRNPFQSVHAIALANLGELASGLAFLTTIPENWRGIVTQIQIDYFKKARGKITAECRTEFPNIVGPFTVGVDLKDGSGEVVARTTATWNIGLKENRSS